MVSWLQDMEYSTSRLATHCCTLCQWGINTERRPTCTICGFVGECSLHKGAGVVPRVSPLSCGRDSSTDPGHLKLRESLSAKDTNRICVLVWGLVDSTCRSSCLCTALTRTPAGTGGPFHSGQNGRPADDPS